MKGSLTEECVGLREHVRYPESNSSRKLLPSITSRGEGKGREIELVDSV